MRILKIPRYPTFYNDLKLCKFALNYVTFYKQWRQPLFTYIFMIAIKKIFLFVFFIFISSQAKHAFLFIVLNCYSLLIIYNK